MRIDWRTDRNAPRCQVVNLDTGEVLSPCAMADEEAGEAEQYVVSGTFPTKCRYEIDPGTGHVKTRTVRARIAIIPLQG